MSKILCVCTYEGCKAEYATLVDECEACTWPTALTKDGYLATLRAHHVLMERAQDVAGLLGHHDADVSFDSWSDHEGATFTIKWTSANCGRGCCGSSDHEKEVPLRYLWMDNAAIKAEIDAENFAKVQKAEEERKRNVLRDAEARVAQARARAATAASEAVRELEAAEASLAKLKVNP